MLENNDDDEDETNKLAEKTQRSSNTKYEWVQEVYSYLQILWRYIEVLYLK